MRKSQCEERNRMHLKYMDLALRLAEKGRGKASPGPMVGAVLVKENRIIGQGYYACFGGIHAERAAFSGCGEDPEGAELYVTLEPCCHYGKQPPCTEAILERGIRHVIVGTADPNPLVGGKGIQCLRKAGVEVTVGVREKECQKLNQVFFHFIQTRRPYVTMKYAMTLDGKIASATGQSKWITGEDTRRRAREERSGYAAILTGLGTVLADDPQLTCRTPGKTDPLRIVCDSHLRLPKTAAVVTTARDVPTAFATCCDDATLHRPYLEAGCQILLVPALHGRVDLCCLMDRLGEMEIDSVLLEAGPRLSWSALESGVVQKIRAYVAPMLLGGETALSPIGGPGAASPAQAYRLSPPVIRPIGRDLLLESEVLSCSPES